MTCTRATPARAEAWELSKRIMREVGQSPDGIEGATAFVEKRAPNWAPPD